MSALLLGAVTACDGAGPAESVPDLRDTAGTGPSGAGGAERAGPDGSAGRAGSGELELGGIGGMAGIAGLGAIANPELGGTQGFAGGAGQNQSGSDAGNSGAAGSAGSGAAGAPNQGLGNWFARSRYGLFVHYVPELTIDAAGKKTTDINAIANGFDAQQLADDAAAFGFEYVMFTIMHLRMRPLYPSAVTQRWRPSLVEPERDVVRDLIRALKPKGIPLMLYVHSTDGHDFSVQDRAACGFDDPTNHFLTWNSYVNELFAEIGSRYGSDVAGFYQDMCFSTEYQDRIDKPRIRKSLLLGNPNRVLVGNENTTGRSASSDAMDFASEEYYPSGAPNTWQSFGEQIATVVGGNWWASIPTGRNATRLSGTDLYRVTVLQASSSKAGGMAWDAGVYNGGGWEDGVKSAFAASAALLLPVAASIKGTLPSTAYPTPQKGTINDVPDGIVATKSTDERYEYIHVLRPPASKTLALPPARDKRLFSSAILLASGRPVVLDTSNGVKLTLGSMDSWSPVDTVIRLTVK